MSWFLTMLDPLVTAAYQLVSWLVALLSPLFGGTTTAVAIVLFTLSVRLLLHPLHRAQIRGERTRIALGPEMKRLQDRYRNDRQRLQQESTALFQRYGVTPFAGCLPMLAQAPFFSVMYRLFLSVTVAGSANLLLHHDLFGAPLGQHWWGAVTASGMFGTAGLVFLGLFALLAVVAWWSSRRQRALAATNPTPAPTGMIAVAARVMPFLTIAVAAYLPLAAGLYLLTTTAWTAVERTVLMRHPRTEPRPATDAAAPHRLER